MSNIFDSIFPPDHPVRRRLAPYPHLVKPAALLETVARRYGLSIHHFEFTLLPPAPAPPPSTSASSSPSASALAAEGAAAHLRKLRALCAASNINNNSNSNSNSNNGHGNDDLGAMHTLSPPGGTTVHAHVAYPVPRIPLVERAVHLLDASLHALRAPLIFLSFARRVGPTAPVLSPAPLPSTAPVPPAQFASLASSSFAATTPSPTPLPGAAAAPIPAPVPVSVAASATSPAHASASSSVIAAATAAAAAAAMAAPSTPACTDMTTTSTAIISPPPLPPPTHTLPATAVALPPPAHALPLPPPAATGSTAASEPALMAPASQPQPQPQAPPAVKRSPSTPYAAADETLAPSTYVRTPERKSATLMDGVAVPLRAPSPTPTPTPVDSAAAALIAAAPDPAAPKTASLLETAAAAHMDNGSGGQLVHAQQHAAHAEDAIRQEQALMVQQQARENILTKTDPPTTPSANGDGDPAMAAAAATASEMVATVSAMGVSRDVKHENAAVASEMVERVTAMAMSKGMKQEHGGPDEAPVEAAAAAVAAAVPGDGHCHSTTEGNINNNSAPVALQAATPAAAPMVGVEMVDGSIAPQIVQTHIVEDTETSRPRMRTRTRSQAEQGQGVGDSTDAIGNGNEQQLPVVNTPSVSIPASTSAPTLVTPRMGAQQQGDLHDSTTKRGQKRVRDENEHSDEKKGGANARMAKRGRRSSAVGRVCGNCGCTETRQWLSIKGVWHCHQCGQYWRKFQRPRPQNLWNRTPVARRPRTSLNTPTPTAAAAAAAATGFSAGADLDTSGTVSANGKGTAGADVTTPRTPATRKTAASSRGLVTPGSGSATTTRSSGRGRNSQSKNRSNNRGFHQIDSANFDVGGSANSGRSGRRTAAGAAGGSSGGSARQRSGRKRANGSVVAANVEAGRRLVEISLGLGGLKKRILSRSAMDTGEMMNQNSNNNNVSTNYNNNNNGNNDLHGNLSSNNGSNVAAAGGVVENGMSATAQGQAMMGMIASANGQNNAAQNGGSAI